MSNPFDPDDHSEEEYTAAEAAYMADQEAQMHDRFLAAADTAALPYAGTSGWSGTDTSEQRARDADTSGTTGKRQHATLVEAGRFAEYGITVKELREVTGWHHGNASGALSVLHKVGKLAMLEIRRNRCHVYVLPQYVDDRPTRPHGGRVKVDDKADWAVERLHALRQQDIPADVAEAIMKHPHSMWEPLSALWHLGVTDSIAELQKP